MAQPWAMALYQSRQWRELRQALIIERGLHCQLCGRMVSHPSNLIGDHIEELTPDNVNNPAISLNPDNVQLICEDCHNQKHKRFGYNTKAAYIVYGSPCSGKTTLVNQLRQRGDILIDMDRLYEAISGCSLYDKPDNIKTAVFAARDALLDVVKTRNGQWANAYIIGGYPHKAQRDALAKRLGATLIYCEATRDECMAKAIGPRATEWKKYISKWFDEFEP